MGIIDMHMVVRRRGGWCVDVRGMGGRSSGGRDSGSIRVGVRGRPTAFSVLGVGLVERPAGESVGMDTGELLDHVSEVGLVGGEDADLRLGACARPALSGGRRRRDAEFLGPRWRRRRGIRWGHWVLK